MKPATIYPAWAISYEGMVNVYTVDYSKTITEDLVNKSGGKLTKVVVIPYSLYKKLIKNTK